MVTCVYMYKRLHFSSFCASLLFVDCDVNVLAHFSFHLVELFYALVYTCLMYVAKAGVLELYL